MEHAKTECIKVGVNEYSYGKISEWKCPICNVIFECGSEYNNEAFCDGRMAA